MSRDRRAVGRRVFAATVALCAAVVSACASAPPPIDRELIPGTRVSLSLPPGFHVADKFSGIVDRSGSTSVIVTEIESPAEETMKGMTEREFANRGMRWIDSERIDIDGRQALVVHAVEPTADAAPVRRSIAVLGDSKQTVMIAASTTIPADADEVWVLRDVLVTAAWEPDREIDPYLGLGFRVDGTKLLQLSDRLPGLVSFTVGGNRGKLRADDPLFLAGTSVAKNRVTDIEAFGRFQLMKMSEFEVSEIQSSRTLKLDGLPAHEIEAAVTDRSTGTLLQVHQTLVLADDRYFLLQGMVGRRNADEVVPHFRQISSSFRVAR